MEHHNGPHRRVTEKNLYLLHLDKARIILIAFVVLGVIIASFLLGMNFVKGDGDSIITQNDVIMENQNSNGLLNRDVPPLPDSSEINIGENDTSKSEGNVEISTVPSNEGNKTADIFTKENIEELIEPSKSAKKSQSTKIAATPTKARKVVSRKTRERRTTQKKKRSKRVRVAAVSHTTTPKRNVRKSPYFAIQIASYDSRSRAMREVRKLKDKRFDAFVDGTRVNGKKFYRVRVGPISSKRSATRVLHRIQDYNQYEESYLVKE